MIQPPMFDAPLWHDYFVMVGGGAAALTGLVFVAMSMHLSEISSNPRHRHRSRTILTALTAIFVRCALVLMGGQGARAVAIEIFGVIVLVQISTARSLDRALRDPELAERGGLIRSVGLALRGQGTPNDEVLWRTLSYIGCLLVEQIGAVALFLGHTWGLYVIGVGMMTSFLFIVSGAWLLLVGIDEEARRTAEQGG